MKAEQPLVLSINDVIDNIKVKYIRFSENNNIIYLVICKKNMRRKCYTLGGMLTNILPVVSCTKAKTNQTFILSE